MIIDVQYGEIVELHVPNKFGVRAMLTNATIKQNGQTEQDAVLILARRSFGVGRSHIILRQNAYQIRDVTTLIPVAFEACKCLFGSHDKDYAHRIADLLLDHVEDLVNHPPEDIVIEQKRREKEIEQMGAIIKVNDTTFLDAR